MSASLGGGPPQPTDPGRHAQHVAHLRANPPTDHARRLLSAPLRSATLYRLLDQASMEELEWARLVCEDGPRAKAISQAYMHPSRWERENQQ